MRMLLRANGLLLHCILVCKYHFVVSFAFLERFQRGVLGFDKGLDGECVFGVEILWGFCFS